MAKRKCDTKRKDVAYALAMGWTYVGVAGSGHMQFTHPAVPYKMMMASTPSEWRSMQNTISWIRRNTPPPPQEDTDA